MSAIISDQSTVHSEQEREPLSQWPEPLRNEPIVDPFPTNQLLRWLIPGAIGLIILTIILFTLSRAASKQIVYFANDNINSITHIRADQSQDAITLGRGNVGGGQRFLLGIPTWSPNGQYLATTAANGRQIAIYPSNLLTPTILTLPEGQNFSRMGVAMDGWSEDSRYLAVIAEGAEDGKRSFLLVYNIENVTLISNPIPIDNRAGIHWSSQEKLLFTTTPEDAVPSLQIMDIDGNITPFAPNDGQFMHADAVWNSNGEQIAYVASQTYTNTQDILLGSLWIADADGGNPKQIVSDETIIAPFWKPNAPFWKIGEDTSIYFTRFLPGFGQFELRQISVEEPEAVEKRVGDSTADLIQYSFDRQFYIQWSPNNQHLLFQGQGISPPTEALSNKLAPELKASIQNEIPVKAVAQWSPNNHFFAITSGNLTTQVALFDTITVSNSFPLPTDDGLFVTIADGWSPNSQYLALIQHKENSSELAIVDVQRQTVQPSRFNLDTRAGLSWHPNTPLIMATAIEDDLIVTLKIFDVQNNNTLPFSPTDGQLLHADGSWSPSGSEVVYIARDTIENPLNLGFLTGAIWVAAANGESPRKIVADGLNLAPIWDKDNAHVFFTRYITETDSFELYRTDLHGNVEHLGISNPDFAHFPFDRSLLLDFSPDGRRWSLPGLRGGHQSMALHMANRDEKGTLFSTQCDGKRPFSFQWVPTNRAVLVACPSQPMALHWIDSDRPATAFPSGIFPSWQP